MAARSKDAEAVKRLEEFAAADPNRLGAVAQHLENLGQHAPAEAM